MQITRVRDTVDKRRYVPSVTLDNSILIFTTPSRLEYGVLDISNGYIIEAIGFKNKIICLWTVFRCIFFGFPTFKDWSVETNRYNMAKFYVNNIIEKYKNVLIRLARE